MEYATIITAGISALMSLVTLLLNRRWKKQDKDSERDDECKQTLSRIESKLDAHIEADTLDAVARCRSRIIVFADEVSRGVKHSKEHFDSVRDDCDYYDRYCASHPDYPNRKAEAAKKLIDYTYDELNRTGDWL